MDPALFTPDYDLALAKALKGVDVNAELITRVMRHGEKLSDATPVHSVFYKNHATSTKRANIVRRLAKGISHLTSTVALRKLVIDTRPDLVHFQWSTLPLVDSVAWKEIGRHCATVLTVHDLVPFNGSPSSKLQSLGYSWLLNSVDRLVVHTKEAADKLSQAGIHRDRISVVPHGADLKPVVMHSPRASGEWKVAFFGKIQPYKGLDVLVRALASLGSTDLEGLKVIIAGEPQMTVTELTTLASDAALRNVVELRLRRHSVEEMEALFQEADAFVFPHREIQASGVFFQVAPMGKWIIASDVGAFPEMIDERSGAIFRSGDHKGLARLIVDSRGRRPTSIASGLFGWDEVGRRTRDMYEQVLSNRADAAST